MSLKRIILGILTCLCLNVDIDPEEWREDLAREVPVARREGEINAWYNYENEGHNRDALYEGIQKNLKKNYIGKYRHTHRYYLCRYDRVTCRMSSAYHPVVVTKIV